MSKLKSTIKANNDLAFYYNPENIPNQNLVKETVSYVENNRKDIFSPLDFLNLLWKQHIFVLKNKDNPVLVKKSLLALPLTNEQKHILYFFIIKWFGGVNMQLDQNHKNTLRHIENEFKLYQCNTPEKDHYFKGKSEFEKLTFQQINKLKLKFDTLTYSEKLKFWKENFNEVHYTTSTIGFFRGNENVMEDNEITPENSFSIYPKGKEETELHNRWMLTDVEMDNTIEHANFERVKEKYFETIKDNPRAVEYAEQEIEAIKKQREIEKKTPPEWKRIGGYELGYQSVVQKKDPPLQMDAGDFKYMVLMYAKGVTDAHYMGFLEKELEQLKQNKITSGQHLSVNNLLSHKRNLIAEERERLRRQGEIQDQHAEISRKKCFETHIDKNYNYSPSVEDFKEELAVRNKATHANDFILWLREAKKVYSNSLNYYTQWGARSTGYSRYEIDGGILNLINEKIRTMLASTEPTKKEKQIKSQGEKKYSHKEIAIAHCVMGVIITSENAENILKRHSKLTSPGKLLQKRITKTSDLTKLSNNKTADSKHLKSLESAKRLISGTKNKKGLTDIDRIITAFKTAMDNHY